MTRQFFILGCGKMGSALLNGWISGIVSGDLDHKADFIIIDPFFDANNLNIPSDAVHVFATLQDAATAGYARPDMMLLSVKPQMMAEALGNATSLDLSGCCFISIAAGLSLSALTHMIGAGTDVRVIRTMPNTPAAIGKGMTAVIGNEAAQEDDLALAESLLGVCGLVIRLDDEAQMDAVTALSGSGPAYVFLLAETMAQAGVALGLPEALSRRLADQTIYGAGGLLQESAMPADILRQNVTSKGGTTAAALSVLMGQDGLAELMKKAMSAAHSRSVELGKDS